MKTLKVTLSKDGAQATCTLKYQSTDWPEEEAWLGNHKAFKISQGIMLSLANPLEDLEPSVKHISAKFGWTYHIEDLGGEAKMWTDNVIFK